MYLLSCITYKLQRIALIMYLWCESRIASVPAKSSAHQLNSVADSSKGPVFYNGIT